MARENISFDENGLVPCVTQDWRTGEVLTLAYMNARGARPHASRRGEVHFWSRSRGELWHKGETSGNVQRVRTLRYDCDADARARAGGARRPRLPHGRAHLLPPHARRRARRAARGARRRFSARWPSAAGDARGQLHGRAARPTRRAIGAKIEEEAEEAARAGARGVRRARCARRRPTCSTTSPCCSRRAASASPTRSRSSHEPRERRDLDLRSARASTRCASSPRDHNVVPLRHTFIDDTETPVSAFLKLRGAGPSFLLESAEQGQRFGRWSFLGFRRARVIRFEGGRLEVIEGGRARARRPIPTARSPTICRATASRRSTACRRSPAAPWACSATTWCARSSGCREPNPDDIGTARHGADGVRRAGRVRPPQPPGDDHGERVRRRRRDIESRYERGRRR